jgi:hypothetical protein
MHVILSRFRRLSNIKLYTPLWAAGDDKARETVITFYHRKCKLSSDERAEMQRLHALATTTEARLLAAIGHLLPPHLQ